MQLKWLQVLLENNKLFRKRSYPNKSGIDVNFPVNLELISVLAQVHWFLFQQAQAFHPADFCCRPSNGQDANDQTPIYWECFDDPGSTAQQTYGFTYRRESGGSGSIYFGYSVNNNSIYAFHTNVMIIAREVVRWVT